MRKNQDLTPILKICGITRIDDALHAVREGATAIGFVFWRKSPRYVDPDLASDIAAALPSDVTTVGVFVDEDAAVIRQTAKKVGFQMIQLHGDEPATFATALDRPILRAVTLDTVTDEAQAWPRDVTLLLDAIDPARRGGTGVAIDWSRAATIARQRRVVLAGGLTPDNIEEAIATVRPFGVDVSSGVEARPGVKDPDKVSLFLANARAAFAR
jgi:phosphoribosylanthranilate isomerase